MTKSQSVDKCLITGEDVIDILDLGMHPYADTFIKQDQLHLSEPVLPLQCTLAPTSGQIQLKYLSNDEERYNLYSYSYTSANSAFSRQHWDSYFNTVKSIRSLEDSRVLEIGSNDGYLLSKFKDSCVEILGVDSSKEMCEYSLKNGVPCLNKLFTLSLALELKQDKLWDIIIANNVFNHSNDPLDFAKGVNALLSESGLFIYELPYWGASVASEKFDQIYHEHISYFTLKSSICLLERAGLEVVDFDIVDYHGGSIRVYSRKASGINIRHSRKISSFVEEEIKQGLFNPETYLAFQSRITSKRDSFMQKLYELRASNPKATIIGVGAAAKANTFLNFYNIDKSVINYITDTSEFKQGKYTPLTRIPIVSDDIFKQYTDDIYALILSWNISDILKEKLLQLNPNLKFLIL